MGFFQLMKPKKIKSGEVIEYSIEYLEKLHGLEGLKEIVKDKPFGANIFKISSGEYINHFYQSPVGQYNWMYYSGLYAEWFPFATYNKSQTEDMIALDVIEEYLKRFDTYDHI